MLEKITVTDGKIDETKKIIGRKPAKLSAIDVFRAKTQAIKPKAKPEEKAPTAVETPSTNATQITPNIAPTTSINFPSSEECQRRLDNQNVSCTEILDLEKITAISARKLRAAVRVPRLVGHIYQVRTKNVKTEPEKTVAEEANVYDFSKSFESMTADHKEEVEKEKPVEKPYSWLRNDETAIKQVKEKDADDEEDSNVVEFQTLMEQKATTADSLATQREILMNLRKQVEKNNLLCEAKKRDLIEENMALTQELNDVLAEINQLSDTVSQQEAFLGLDEGKSKTA